MARTTVERRRFERLPIKIPVVVKGKDANGREFFDRGEVVSIDRRGARLRTRFALKVGAEIELDVPNENGPKRLRVIWRGEVGGLQDGLIGIEFVDPDDSWNLKTLHAQWGS